MGVFISSLITMTMSGALFGRRGRSGWLSELEEMRHDALHEAHGEVSVAMADLPRWDDPGDDDIFVHEHAASGANGHLTGMGDLDHGNGVNGASGRHATALQRPAAELLHPRPDGTIDIGGGLLRFSEGAGREVVEIAGQVTVELGTGWAWTVVPEGSSHQVELAVPHGYVRVAAGTSALVIVGDDGSSFVTVVVGTAEYDIDAERAALVTGDLAMAVPGGEVRHESAAVEEIIREPLVAHNLGLDAAR